VTTAPISPLVESVFTLAAQQLKPPPRLSISEWANRNFVLSSEDSAEPGQYRTARAPYQREILDALGEPEVEDLVLCCAAQTVKTVAIKIWIAYYVKEDPSAILFLLPGLDLARRVSRQRLAPMFRDVPVLRGLLEEGANRASNATLEKSFPGGVLFLVGANSPAGLSSVPVRIVFADEVNRYPASAGSEGSPLALAEKRTANFWNRKKVKASTPTDDHGMITAEYEKTDMRQYEVPCPGCTEAAGELDGFQVLDFKKLIFDKDPAVEPVYACHHCGAALTEASKPWMLEHGRWVARHPEVRTRRGYQLSALYSPFFTWTQIGREWREAMHHREDKNLLRVFMNTVLALPYNDDAEALDSSELMGRREDYPCPVPDGVTILTAAVDVQADRLELLVRGWGKGQESWLVDRKMFEGDTSRLEGEDLVKEGTDVPSCAPHPGSAWRVSGPRRLPPRPRRASAHRLYLCGFRLPDGRGLRLLQDARRPLGLRSQGRVGFRQIAAGPVHQGQPPARARLSHRGGRDQGHALPPPKDRHARRRVSPLFPRALRRGVFQAAHLGATQAQTGAWLPAALLGKGAGRPQRGARPGGLRLRRLLTPERKARRLPGSAARAPIGAGGARRARPPP